MQEKTFQAAVYLRLSREDGDIIEGSKLVSCSIANQKELVMDYLKSHPEISVYDTYTDDGYTGVNFDRPDFQRMLSDIREGKVNCVIVKDLSRFGRNYSECGRYIEKIFPMLDIRFIAVIDYFDSINVKDGIDITIAFKNLLNDNYCRDISVKVRSHMDIKRRNGDYIGAFASYGYMKDEANKNHLVVDSYAADVVRDIFSMKLCGMSVQAIADKLNVDGILSPLQYKKSIGAKQKTSFAKNLRSKWCYNTVLRILKNEVYTGTVVQGKSTTPNYKVKQRKMKKEAEWIRVSDMHEAIISKSEYDLIQEILRRDTRVSPQGTEVLPLSGMLFCADCGEPMVRKTVPYGGRKYFYYVCSGNKRDKSLCTTHSFPEDKLTKSVLSVVQNYIGRVISASYAMEMINNTPEMKPDIVKIDSRIENLTKEAETCNKRKKNLYEDYTDGLFSREEFNTMNEQFQNQLEEIKKSIASLKEDRRGILENGTGKQKWIEKIKEYKGIKTLDRELVCFLIEKVEVIDKGAINVTFRFENALTEMEKIVDLYSGELKEAM